MGLVLAVVVDLRLAVRERLAKVLMAGMRLLMPIGALATAVVRPAEWTVLRQPLRASRCGLAVVDQAALCSVTTVVVMAVAVAAVPVWVVMAAWLLVRTVTACRLRITVGRIRAAAEAVGVAITVPPPAVAAVVPGLS